MELPEDTKPENVLFEWEVPEDHPRFTEHDDIAQAYMIERCPEANCGIMVWAKYHGQWAPNPWSDRALIRKLVLDLKSSQKV